MKSRKLVDIFKKDGTIYQRIANMYKHGYTYKDISKIAHMSYRDIRKAVKDVNKDERKAYIKALREKYGKEYKKFQRKRVKMVYTIYNKVRKEKITKEIEDFYSEYDDYGS